MGASVQSAKVVLDADAVDRALVRIAHEIVERNPASERLALVGIHTRGVPLAHRLRRLVGSIRSGDVALGTLDITFHRDDLHVRDGEAPLHPQPVVKATRLPFRLEGRTCVLVDDVLYTGRTVRAALDALTDHGRPDAVRLAVLVDRGHRELPIRPDFVGKNLPTSRDELVSVHLVETDGTDEVLIGRHAAELQGPGR